MYLCVSVQCFAAAWTERLIKEGGGSMGKRHPGRWLVWMFAVTLVLLGMRQLVACPEAAAETLPPMPGGQTFWEAALPLSDDSAGTRRDDSFSLRREGVTLWTVQPLMLRSHAEGCGWHITGKSYVRTVYIAFHLEDKAG